MHRSYGPVSCHAVFAVCCIALCRLLSGLLAGSAIPA